MAAFQELLNDIKAYVQSDQTSALAMEMSELEYAGFNPERMLQELAKRAHNHSIDAAKFRSDLTTLAVLGAMRGSNLTRILEKSSEALQKWLGPVVKTYAIKKTPVKNDDATLVRIAAVMVKPLVAGISRGSLSLTHTVPSAQLPTGYPDYMKLSSFGALLPKITSGLSNDHYGVLTAAYLLHQYYFDVIINSKKGNHVPNKDSLNQYMVIQMNSGSYTEEAKLEFLKSIGLLVVKRNIYEISSDVLPALTKAAKTFNDL